MRGHHKWSPDGFEATVERIQQHVLPDTVLPDYDTIDLKQRAPAVNYLMLYGLAERADRRADPHANLAELYHAAEVSLAKGKFKASA